MALRSKTSLWPVDSGRVGERRVGSSLRVRRVRIGSSLGVSSGFGSGWEGSDRVRSDVLAWKVRVGSVRIAEGKIVGEDLDGR